MHSDNSLRANISLTVVILAGAVMLTSGLAVLSNSMDVSLSTKAYLNNTLVEMRATSCIEEAMYRITKDVSYVGQLTIPFTGGSCEVTVTNEPVGASIKKLVVTTTVSGYRSQRTVYGHTDTTPYSLTNQ